MTNGRFIPGLKISVDENTGGIRAAYLQIRQGTVEETREVAEGRAFADYDINGLLLGIELLAPCDLDVLDSIAAKEIEAIKRFVRSSPPRELISA